MRPWHQPFAPEPCRGLLVAFPSDEIEDPSADVGLMVEPGTLPNVDRQRTAIPVPPLMAVLLCRLAEQAKGDGLHERIEINPMGEVHRAMLEVGLAMASSAAPISAARRFGSR